MQKQKKCITKLSLLSNEQSDVNDAKTKSWVQLSLLSNDQPEVTDEKTENQVLTSQR